MTGIPICKRNVPLRQAVLLEQEDRKKNEVKAYLETIKTEKFHKP